MHLEACGIHSPTLSNHSLGRKRLDEKKGKRYCGQVSGANRRVNHHSRRVMLCLVSCLYGNMFSVHTKTVFIFLLSLGRRF